MAKAFDERRCIYVPATGGHPENTEYRIAWGFEQWDKSTPVTKVQMVYNNKVAGRLSPSFPDGTLDKETVISALNLLEEGLGTSSKKSKLVLVRKKIEKELKIDDLIDSTENELKQMYVNMHSVNKSLSPVVRMELVKSKEVEADTLEMLFHVDIS